MKTFVLFASAALLCTAPAANAQDRTDMPSVRVSYGDLDLDRPNGRAVLEQRVSNAIERVCPRPSLPNQLADHKIYRECKAATWTGVRTQLAQIYNGVQLSDSAVRVVASLK